MIHNLVIYTLYCFLWFRYYYFSFVAFRYTIVAYCLRVTWNLFFQFFNDYQWMEMSTFYERSWLVGLLCGMNTIWTFSELWWLWSYIILELSCFFGLWSFYSRFRFELYLSDHSNTFEFATSNTATKFMVSNLYMQVLKIIISQTLIGL